MSVTVIDIGCASHGADQSIGPLLERFRPDRLYGFDPQCSPSTYQAYGAVVTLDNKAGWINDQGVLFAGESLGARVVEQDGRWVGTVDVAEFIEGVASTEVILKLDCEGSEYQIIADLTKRGADKHLKLLLVEWHCPWCGHGVWSHAESCEQKLEAEQIALEMERKLACPVERWDL